MNSQILIRDYRPSDAAALNAIALAVFDVCETSFGFKPTMPPDIKTISDLTRTGEIVVAELGGAIVGGAAYIPAGAPRPTHLDLSWALIRMLVVDPMLEGEEPVLALAEACVARARRDGLPTIAFHSWPVMTTYVSVLFKLGFRLPPQPPEIHGALSAAYLLDLA